MTREKASKIHTRVASIPKVAGRNYIPNTANTAAGHHASRLESSPVSINPNRRLLCLGLPFSIHMKQSATQQCSSWPHTSSALSCLRRSCQSLANWASWLRRAPASAALISICLFRLLRQHSHNSTRQSQSVMNSRCHHRWLLQSMLSGKTCMRGACLAMGCCRAAVLSLLTIPQESTSPNTRVCQ